MLINVHVQWIADVMLCILLLIFIFFSSYLEQHTILYYYFIIIIIVIILCSIVNDRVRLIVRSLTLVGILKNLKTLEL